MEVETGSVGVLGELWVAAGLEAGIGIESATVARIGV